MENLLSTFGQRQPLDKVARTSCQLQFYWTRFPAASPILDTTGCTKSATAYNDGFENVRDENGGGESRGDENVADENI